MGDKVEMGDTIVTEEPQRAVERFSHIPGTHIVALCDHEEERAEKCQKYLQEASLPKADGARKLD